MNEEKKNKSETQPGEEPGKLQCSCMTDPFASLPPEIRPRARNPMAGLRKVTCPGCSLVHWTNRTTDLCMLCEKKGVRLHEVYAEAGE